MKRRQFITTAAYGVGAAWLGSKMTGRALAIPPLTQKFTAADTVVLGSTGIRTRSLPWVREQSEWAIIPTRLRSGSKACLIFF